ncbi:MAG TPA: hypothetical protein VFO19_02265, partial [Vicinamibacterales bacterium]|nr:hypothetical protein [Vicinamibacterales bacterium]
WLTRPGVPKIDGTWRYDADAKQLSITLTQTAPAGGPFRLPLEIGIVAAPGAVPRIGKVEFTNATQTFTMPSDAAPADVVLDPNTWLLFERGSFVKAGSALTPSLPVFRHHDDVRVR